MTAEANSWFTSLPPNSIATWAEMKKLFLEHFFPPTKMNALKKEISGAKQEYDESLSMYWTRFQRLVDSCPNHKFSQGDLLQYFYQGMMVDTKNLVNSASGGGFFQNTVSEAKRICSKRMLSTVVEKVATAGQPTEKSCGACDNFGHTSLQCTGGDEDYQAQVNSSHNFYSCTDPLPPLPKRDPYSNNHNAPWRNHPNFRWRDPDQRQPQQQNYRPRHQRTAPQQAQAPPPPAQEKQGKTLEDMMAELIGNQQFLQGNVQQLQQSHAEYKVQMEGLARQISQLSMSVNQLKGNQGVLPSQVIINPKENCNTPNI
ncbi:uncharacterized protein LOC131018541 [Salvia miltiorrhiza]|uniref:uncharacterized protein LOC131018541 n=1 Tax=Salvia miltiorrhiza TaxID=226208 RepID=UPI0025AC75DF|nr:uncharacterized protein LOC131018541 [Salvia miltiorrhiza]